MTLLSKIFGDANERHVRELQPVVEKINSFEPEFQALSEESLREKTAEFKRRLAGDDPSTGSTSSPQASSGREPLDDLLPEAFAAVREAARRTLGQRHFDVQLIGGIVLHRGAIAEMRTGEGKTLVATLPLYLNSLLGRGCHLVTPNDYLSRVGGGWMGPVYHALGVSVGVIAHDFSGMYDPSYKEAPTHGDERLDHWRPSSRNEAYQADITYGTNNEFGFDYLRDNMAYRLDQTVQLGRRSLDEGGHRHHYAIVDEVDAILIDEARTPLIISAPDAESADYYKTFARIIPQLKENGDYNVDEKLKAVTITEEGIEKVEKILGIENIYEEKGFRYVRYLEQGLRAHALFQRDRDYVLKDGQIIIVDEFTGRLMPGRRWSEGLHQAIEAKEGVEVQRESRTLATITFQNYFRLYEKLAGMTGTAATSAEEFHKVYKMDVVTIPTNKTQIRKDDADLIFRTGNGRLMAVAREVKAKHEKGQPVLLGTVSIEKSERLSEYLKREGIPHRILNAKNHEAEAMVIAQAGRWGAVTVATNMAGRGVDILLGGTPQDPKEADRVRELGGLHIIGTERHEARRIDNQLRGRAGRQGDPGSSQFFLSLEDDLMRIFGSDRIKSMMESFGIPEDEPIENRLVTKSIESAQSKIEGFHFDARKHILDFDDVMNKQREYVYRLRREILEAGEGDAPGLIAKLDQMIAEEVSMIVAAHTSSSDPDTWNLEEIAETMRSIADIPGTLREELNRIAGQHIGFEERREEVTRYLAETLKILLEDRRKIAGDRTLAELARVVMLQAVDTLWMDHLDEMEHLRDSVRLRAYGQRDPLVEYKHEGVRLFRELQRAIRSQIVGTIFKAAIASWGAGDGGRGSGVRQPARPADLVFKGAASDTPQQTLVGSRNRAPAGVKKPVVGRNNPCPCGAVNPRTGNVYKYKNCGLINAPHHKA